MIADKNGFRVVRFVAPLAIAASLGSSACSSKPPIPPDAAIASELGAGTQAGATMMCPLGIGMSWIAIGPDTDTTISTGSHYLGDPVTVGCTVHSTGSAFDVTLSALLGGQGSISVSHANISSDTTQVNMNVQGSFARGNTGDFVESDCTFDFGGQPTDLDPSKTAGAPLGVAPGRIWGNLTCPMIVNNEDGNVCLAQAEMRFENCNE
jgi:hypothetical protein